MIAAWVEDYIGIPYRFAASERSGCDCWGLVRLILSEQFGVSLPAFDRAGLDRQALAALVDEAMPLVNAVEIMDPEPGDLALLRIAGAPCHVGVIVGDGYMVHSLTPHDSVLERYNGLRWSPRLEGVFRVR